MISLLCLIASGWLWSAAHLCLPSWEKEGCIFHTHFCKEIEWDGQLRFFLAQAQRKEVTMLIHTQRLCKQQKDNVPYCKRQKGVNPRALSWLEKVGAIDTKSPFNSILSTDAPQVQGLGAALHLAFRTLPRPQSWLALFHALYKCSSAWLKHIPDWW